MAATTAGLFLASAGAPAFFLNWAAIFGQGADMDFYGLERAPYIRKSLNLLDYLWRKRDYNPAAFRVKAVDPAGPPRSPCSHAGR
jgi:hypothetical protein